MDVSMSCGWCVHDRICTGNPSTCRHEDDWRSLADVQGVSVAHHICRLKSLAKQSSMATSYANLLSQLEL